MTEQPRCQLEHVRVHACVAFARRQRVQAHKLDALSPALLVAVVLAGPHVPMGAGGIVSGSLGLAPTSQLVPSAPRPADPEPEIDEETAPADASTTTWLEPKKRPFRTPWPVTFSTVAALAGGSRSFHGSFGLSVGSQHLGAASPSGERRFVSFGASVFVRWYTPHPQVGCGDDAAPPPPRPHCPATLSGGPTFRWGIVRNESPSFSVPRQRYDVAVTPFIGREPLRDPGRGGLAAGARVALSATYGGSSQDILDDPDTSENTLAFLAILPAALINHLEIYGEPMVLDGRLYVSAGLGLGFGL